MYSKNKMIICLSVLLVCCIVYTGCTFSPASETGQNSVADLTGNLDYYGTVSAIVPPEHGTEPLKASTKVPDYTTAHADTSAAAAVKTPSTTRAAATVTKKVPSTTKAATTVPVKPSGIVLDNLLGQSLADITSLFGSPAAIEKSEYGFYWYVYHNNYTHLVMVGIQNNKVVGLYSNSASLMFEGFTVGTARSAVRQALTVKKYAGPMKSIVKGNTEYVLQRTEQRDVFSNNQEYITVFYDNIKGGTLTAVQIINYSTEQNFGFFAAPDKEFTDSYERIGFYLINSVRVRFNKPVLQYDKNMAKIAAAHSQDMITRSFFGHINPDGLGPGERIKAAGYDFCSYAENITKNHPNAICAHESLMNSQEHRENILGKTKFVGIGVRMTQDSILQTELFITYTDSD